MGVIYSVACKECKVVRYLDKFYDSGNGVETREDALKYCETLQGNFRAALLVSFMSKHKGHDCVFFDENEHEYLDPYVNSSYREDTDFWKVDA